MAREEIQKKRKCFEGRRGGKQGVAGRRGRRPLQGIRAWGSLLKYGDKNGVAGRPWRRVLRRSEIRLRRLILRVARIAHGGVYYAAVKSACGG